jgi:hypothetical protein
MLHGEKADRIEMAAWKQSRLLEEAVLTTTHPSELTLTEISRMDRASLIEQLLLFNDYCAFRFSRNRLASLSSQELRGLLYAARRHYHNKGY